MRGDVRIDGAAGMGRTGKIEIVEGRTLRAKMSSLVQHLPADSPQCLLSTWAQLRLRQLARTSEA